MPIWVEKTKTWIGRIRLKGYPIKVKKGFPRKADAINWEREEKERLMEPEKTVTGFAQFAEAYLDFCFKRFQKNTSRQKLFIIKSLLASIGHDPPIDDPDLTKYIIQYLDKRFDESGGKSANRDLREIETLFNWIIKYEYPHLKNPAKPIERYSENEFVKYVPTVEDIQKALAAAEGDEYVFLMTIIQTAARSGELLRLTWNDINFDTGIIKLWTRKRRGGGLESRDIKITPSLFYVLHNRQGNESQYVFPNKKGGRGSKNTWDKRMPRLCKKAGIKPFGFHAIRHFISVRCSQNNIPMADIQKLLGHKRMTTTDTYMKSLTHMQDSAVSFLESIGQEIANGKIVDIKKVKNE